RRVANPADTGISRPQRYSYLYCSAAHRPLHSFPTRRSSDLRNIRRRITIPLTLSNLKLLRRITRTENILHRNFTRRQVAIQNRVASNIGISQSTFSVKVLNLFSRSRRKTNRRKSKHSAM